MKGALKLLKALSDESRLRILLALRNGEMRVCQLIEPMGLSPSTVSKHLSILRDAGVLASRREGRWVYYRAAARPLFPMFGKKAAPFFQSLEKSPPVKADDKHLKRICRMSVESLCRRLFSASHERSPLTVGAVRSKHSVNDSNGA